jgi:NADH dehydrogenase
MKVLITGGTGYIGGKLREHIRKEGHEVRVLVRKGSEDKLHPVDAYEIVQGDIFNTNACLRASDGCDAVVHLVGIIREFPSKGITFDQYHRVATWNIVDAARRSGVPRFVHMSALGTREDASSTYHQTKYAGEQVVMESGLRWTVFRPSIVMGSGDDMTKQIVDLIHKPVVPLINGGKTLFQPIALDDVCTAMSKSLLMPETQQQIYELGGPDRVSFRDLVAMIADQLNVKIRTTNVPAWMIKPVAAMLGRLPWFPVTVDQLRMLTEDNVCEIDRYVKTFQIEPRSLAQIVASLQGLTPEARRRPVLL